jgi:phenylacetate-CoA ligase
MRTSILPLLLKLGKRGSFHALSTIQNLSNASPDEVNKYQEEKLSALLRHAHRHSPYYQKVLEEAEVVQNNDILLQNFQKIQPLSKGLLRQHFEDLKCQDGIDRGAFPSSSGGSSGTPVPFLHDQPFWDVVIATKIHFAALGGKQIGEKELRLWGSEKDLLEGKESPSIALRNFLYGRKELNAFTMTPERLPQYIESINRYQPKIIEAYVQPIYELARFAKENKLKLYSPSAVLTSAGTLYPDMKKLLKEVFQCPILNRYGSREVGDMACNCPKDEGLHLAPYAHYFEILNEQNQPVSPGELGRVHVTSLHNFSMPLIRYDIGDIASFSDKSCSCGSPFPLLEKVEGREMSVFKTKGGGIVPAEYFIHFVGVVLNKGYVGRFQVIQEDFDHILVKMVIHDQAGFDEHKHEISDSIRKVMGEECRIEYQAVEEIPPLSNGKYLYTLSKIP